MSKVVLNSVVLGQSGTASNNFLLDTDAAGALRIRRNADGSGGTVLNVDSSNRVSGTLTLGTVQNTTSGTSISFTSIPSWVKRITLSLVGVSTTGTSPAMVQIGSGSVQTTGYAGSVLWYIGGVGNGTATNTSGALLDTGSASAAGSVRNGHVVLTLVSGNTWVISANIGNQGLGTGANCTSGFTVTLSSTLDRVVLTTVGGTDTFDAGSVNILYEG